MVTNRRNFWQLEAGIPPDCFILGFRRAESAVPNEIGGKRKPAYR